MEFLAESYVDAVLNGEQTTNEIVRMACVRHRNDLESGQARGLFFDAQAARVAILFFNVLRHWKGEWAGQSIVLEPWQQFFLWMLFGWKRADGTRRFRTAYLEVARKNGKTTLAAGVGLLLSFVEGEPGAEVYTAATKRDQARIAHRDATEMVRRSPQLKQIIKVFKDNLHNVEMGAKFEPLGRDADSLDGLNVHGAICDEVHAWRGRDLWDILETATGARRQPLMLAITTAGFDRQSLCYQLHEYAIKVNNGLVQDDSFLGLIYGLDDGDDWEDEANWGKANPNLDVSKKRDDMRRQAKRAREMPAQLNAFLRLHLNVWTQVEDRWMNPDKWRACGKRPLPDLIGRRCYGGLDLSSTTDVSALVWVFPPEDDDEPYWVLPRFWIPLENLQERVRRDRVPYDAWLRDGLIEATPGNVIDYDFILAQIEQDMGTFDVGEVAFDRWGAARIVTQLQNMGVEVVQFGQGFASMSAPMRELEKLVLARDIAHGGNAPLAWMADNVVGKQDPAGNIKPDKSRSIEKIDGIVALIMALDRAVRHGAVQVTSVYEERGIRSI